MNMGDILVRPVITEKSIADAGRGRFTFQVARQAEKGVIRRAVETQFKVGVTAIWTITVPGKTYQSGAKRTEKKAQPWKKAVVTLKENQKIDLFDVGGASE